MKQKIALLAGLSAAMVMGTSVNAFANESEMPSAAATRETVVTMLWKQEGEPVVNYTMPFTDIAGDATEAVRWAAAEKIVSGYGNGKFEPDLEITREQMAAILYRYAAYRGHDVSIGENTNILSYADAFHISEYAVPAVQWACGRGVFSGTEEGILPSASVTENEAAAMIEKAASPKNTKIIAEIPEESISLLYEGDGNFVLNSKDAQAHIQWNCLVDNSYQPVLTLTDLNGDGKDEICIILTLGAGSGFHVEGIAVYEKDGLQEYFVPDPREIAEPLISYDETADKYLISTKDGISEITDLGSYGELVFSDNVRYTIADHKLTATVLLQTSPDTFCGELQIEYQPAAGGFILQEATFSPNR
ncbi:MAG: S-layer homology domain-containing protein [Bacteroidales bacterium]|nr:S-layer homology domain-containing protein [Bacteroidales bacterium]